VIVLYCMKNKTFIEKLTTEIRIMSAAGLVRIKSEMRFMRYRCALVEDIIKEVAVLILNDPSDNALRMKREDLIHECQEIELIIYQLEGELEMERERLARQEE
jgi:hypothetical protein